MTKPSAPLRFVLNLDGVDHPVVIEEITARQAGELGLFFGREPLSLRDRLLSQTIDVVDAAALVWLSKRQRGKLADADRILDTITIGSQCTVTYEEPVDGSTGPDADPEP